MMEVENSLAEKFISELPDDLSEARVIAEVPEELEGTDENGLVDGIIPPQPKDNVNGHFHARVIRKAKRTTKANSFSEEGNQATPGLVNLNRTVKKPATTAKLHWTRPA